MNLSTQPQFPILQVGVCHLTDPKLRSAAQNTSSPPPPPPPPGGLMEVDLRPSPRMCMELFASEFRLLFIASLGLKTK